MTLCVTPMTSLSSDCGRVTHWTNERHCLQCILYSCLPAGLGLGQYPSEICYVGFRGDRPSACPIRSASAWNITYFLIETGISIQLSKKRLKQSNLPHFHFCSHAFLVTFRKSYATRRSQQTAETVH